MTVLSWTGSPVLLWTWSESRNLLESKANETSEHILHLYTRQKKKPISMSREYALQAFYRGTQDLCSCVVPNTLWAALPYCPKPINPSHCSAVMCLLGSVLFYRNALCVVLFFALLHTTKDCVSMSALTTNRRALCSRFICANGPQMYGTVRQSGHSLEYVSSKTYRKVGRTILDVYVNII